jgi:hypothetical protein
MLPHSLTLPLSLLLLLFSFAAASSNSPTLADCLKKHGKSLHLTDAEIDVLTPTELKQNVVSILFGKNIKPTSSGNFRRDNEVLNEQKLIELCAPLLPAGALSRPLYQLKYQPQCDQSGKAELLRLRLLKLIQKNMFYDISTQTWQTLATPCTTTNNELSFAEKTVTAAQQWSASSNTTTAEATSSSSSSSSSPSTSATKVPYTILHRTLPSNYRETCLPLYPRSTNALLQYETNVGIPHVNTKECDTLCALHPTCTISITSLRRNNETFFGDNIFLDTKGRRDLNTVCQFWNCQTSGTYMFAEEHNDFLSSFQNSNSIWNTQIKPLLVESKGLLLSSWGTSFATDQYSSWLTSPGAGILSDASYGSSTNSIDSSTNNIDSTDSTDSIGRRQVWWSANRTTALLTTALFKTLQRSSSPGTFLNIHYVLESEHATMKQKNQLDAPVLLLPEQYATVDECYRAVLQKAKSELQKQPKTITFIGKDYNMYPYIPFFSYIPGRDSGFCTYALMQWGDPRKAIEFETVVNPSSKKYNSSIYYIVHNPTMEPQEGAQKKRCDTHGRYDEFYMVFDGKCLMEMSIHDVAADTRDPADHQSAFKCGDPSPDQSDSDQLEKTKYLCGACMGGCSSDADCLDTLRCSSSSVEMSTVTPHSIPGCYGNALNNMHDDENPYFDKEGNENTLIHYSTCYTPLAALDAKKESDMSMLELYGSGAWQMYGAPRVKGVSLPAINNNPRSSILWSAFGDINNISTHSSSVSLHSSAIGGSDSGSGCRWDPLPATNTSSRMMSCSSVLREMYDDECFFGMLSGLSTRQRNWVCRMMSERGCQFVKGDCDTLVGLD